MGTRFSVCTLPLTDPGEKSTLLKRPGRAGCCPPLRLARRLALGRLRPVPPTLPTCASVCPLGRSVYKPSVGIFCQGPNISGHRLFFRLNHFIAWD